MYVKTQGKRNEGKKEFREANEATEQSLDSLRAWKPYNKVSGVLTLQYSFISL